MVKFILCTLLSFAFVHAEETPPEKSSSEVVQENLNAPEGMSFTPPDGWRFVEPSALPPNVKVMAVGKGKGDFPPSINLGFDTYQGSIKEYVKKIKAINKEDGVSTKDLGKVKTSAGSAALIQVDFKSKWGDERQLQAIFLHNNKAWILTCSALKKEFPSYYKTFFEAIRSFAINNAA